MRLPNSFTAPSNRDKNGPQLSADEHSALRTLMVRRMRFTVAYTLTMFVGLVLGLVWMRAKVPNLVPPAGFAMGPYGWLHVSWMPQALLLCLTALWLASYLGLWIWGLRRGTPVATQLAYWIALTLLVLHFLGCQRGEREVNDKLDQQAQPAVNSLPGL